MNDFQNHCNLIAFVWTALLLKSSKRLNNQNTIYVKFEYFVQRNRYYNRKKIECMKKKQARTMVRFVYTFKT